MSRETPEVFVIAPEDVAVQVRKAAAVLRFSSSEEFERWRRGACARVEAAVDAALDAIDVRLEACSLRTQEVLLHLRGRESIPSVKELLASSSSRRSFYRSWTGDMPESPAAFLERVRRLHLREAARGQSAAQHGTSGGREAVP